MLNNARKIIAVLQIANLFFLSLVLAGAATVIRDVHLRCNDNELRISMPQTIKVNFA